ncbi:hypothetical protein [Rhodococcus sp. SORGH_AS_0303]|uniref:hypothetical protein n=1 Tax=Rhodococcus sp. SORGH_AS_0303 TaxID=3041753 RepID=UPI00278A4D21|nr:hypothetical protein [Rhodococcus sp. SORGH_AS_0303]MDQ1201088.1 hypothetical protein [Rhodococcus sp. SORGH_AS_0303]
MTDYTTLSAAMDAKDDLAEVELRYRLLSETFESVPQLRANLNPALERAKAEILRLRAASGARRDIGSTDGVSAQVIAFDSARFQKAGEKKSTKKKSTTAAESSSSA